jgi:hypothetical protein
VICVFFFYFPLLQIVKKNIVYYLLHVGNFIQQIPVSKFE